MPRLHLAAAFVIVRFILGVLLARGPAPVSVRKQREERYRGEDPRTDQADSGTMHRGVRVQNAVNAANEASDENGRTWKCGAEHRSVAVGVVLSCPPAFVTRLASTVNGTPLCLFLLEVNYLTGEALLAPAERRPIVIRQDGRLTGAGALSTRQVTCQVTRRAVFTVTCGL